MKKRLQLLLKFPFLFSLIVLILNDHILKQVYPSWVTGKLSDFAGLFVFCVLLFVLFGYLANTKYSLLVLHSAVAGLFIIWKLAPVEYFTNWLMEVTTLPMPTRVKDASDLIALTSVILSYKWLNNSTTTIPTRRQYLRVRHFSAIVILLITGWSVMATSPRLYDYHVPTENGIKSNFDIEESLMKVEAIMIENGFEVYKKQIVDSTNYRLNFSWIADTSIVGMGKGGGFFNLISYSDVEAAKFHGHMDIYRDLDPDTYAFKMKLSSIHGKFDKDKIQKAIEELLYDKFREALNE